MRKAWLKTVAAALAAVGMAATAADGSPAGMAVSSAQQAEPAAPVRLAARPTSAWEASTPQPSSQISPLKNPVKYFTAAISEMPIPSIVKSGPLSRPKAPPVVPEKSDPVVVSTPVVPPTPELLISTAQSCERQGDVRQARVHFGKALTTWPGNVEVLRAAARMEDRVGDMALAETLYRQAVVANPQHAGALNDLGLCLARQGKLDASLQVLEQAIHLQPAKALYRNNAATVLVEMRQDQRALGHLAAVHAPADANYNLGQLLVRRGRGGDATTYFQAAVDLNPAMDSARVALANQQGATAAPATSPAASVPNQPPPSAASGTSPQYAPQAGPQLNYPSTALSPGYNTSSYVPPTYYAPRVAPPRYLPAVANRPGATVR